MTDPSECSVHAGAELDLDSEEAKRLAGLLRRLLPRRKEGGEPADDLPVAHEDAIRVAHKCLRTSKAFHHRGGLAALQGDRPAGRRG